MERRMLQNGKNTPPLFFVSVVSKGLSPTLNIAPLQEEKDGQVNSPLQEGTRRGPEGPPLQALIRGATNGPAERSYQRSGRRQEGVRRQ